MNGDCDGPTIANNHAPCDVIRDALDGKFDTIWIGALFRAEAEKHDPQSCVRLPLDRASFVGARRPSEAQWRAFAGGALKEICLWKATGCTKAMLAALAGGCGAGLTSIGTPRRSPHWPIQVANVERSGS